MCGLGEVMRQNEDGDAKGQCGGTMIFGEQNLETRTKREKTKRTGESERKKISRGENPDGQKKIALD